MARCDKYTQYAVPTLSVTKEAAKVRNVPESIDLVQINIRNSHATSSVVSCVETQQTANPKS